jgi:hypothetical protein
MAIAKFCNSHFLLKIESIGFIDDSLPYRLLYQKPTLHAKLYRD